MISSGDLQRRYGNPYTLAEQIIIVQVLLVERSSITPNDSIPCTLLVLEYLTRLHVLFSPHISGNRSRELSEASRAQWVQKPFMVSQVLSEIGGPFGTQRPTP